MNNKKILACRKHGKSYAVLNLEPTMISSCNHPGRTLRSLHLKSTLRI
uniref:Uncharacterized protein n=1 Tax=Arundo donax TaxID=35708 RepID=A0A0A9AD35_ARUDO